MNTTSSSLEQTVEFLEEISLLTSEEIKKALGDRTLKASCVGCHLLTDVMKNSDAHKSEQIIDDVAKNCPFTSGYMGAVVTTCIIDARLYQDQQDVLNDDYIRGEI